MNKYKTIEEYEHVIVEIYRAIRSTPPAVWNNGVKTIHNLFYGRNKLLMKEFKKGKRLDFHTLQWK